MIVEVIGHLLILGRKVGAVCIRQYYLKKFSHAGRGVSMGHHFVCHGPENIRVGDNVSLGHHVTLRSIPVYPWSSPPQRFEPIVELHDGVFVNSFTELAAANSIVIENDVMIAEGCFITDNAHKYDDTSRSVKEQAVEVLGEVRIGAGSLVGCRTFIQGNVSIGKQCVIGANSVVLADVPDYCIAVGAPARIVKRFDPESNAWRKTTPDGEFKP
jgi:acetyltransferase-like isoleucine patch superfamily enzyme